MDPNPQTPPPPPVASTTIRVVHGPYTAAQVEALTAWQRTAGTQAVTCGAPRHETVPLEPGRDGWRCPLCDYTQTWAPAHALETAAATEATHGDTPAPQLPHAPAPAPGDARCGEECCEGHVYAGRCTQTRPANHGPEQILEQLRDLHTRGPGPARTPLGLIDTDDVCRSCHTPWPCPTGRILDTTRQEQP